MWKNTAQPDRPQMTIWRKRILRCIPKATNTHTQYVTLFACDVLFTLSFFVLRYVEGGNDLSVYMALKFFFESELVRLTLL